MTNLYLGFDPGKNGGVCILGKNLITDVLSCKYLKRVPTDEDTFVKSLTTDIKKIITSSVGLQDTFCIMESVGGYIGKDQPASTAFVFGYYTGLLNSVMYSIKCKYRKVQPKDWQKFYQMGRNGCTYDQHKRNLRDRAIYMFPEWEDWINLDTCDALLMAFYCSQMQEKYKDSKIITWKTNEDISV